MTTDGLASYPRAVKEGLGSEVEHPSNRYLNNLIEQDHRGIKQRYYRMLGFKSFDCAAVFCPVFDELRNFFRFRKEVGGEISLAERRRIHLARVAAFNVLMGIS